MSDERRPVTVTVLDTETGETRPGGGWDAFWWAEGNGSCDCNRALLFGRGSPDAGACDGCRRYLVVAPPAADEFTLLDFNAGYPLCLVRRHLPELFR